MNDKEINIVIAHRGYGKCYKEYKEVIEYFENEIKQLEKENQQLKKQKDDVVEYCKNSIKSINDRLAFVDTKKSYPNEHQRVRLKAFRTKCKEILRLLGECNE